MGMITIFTSLVPGYIVTIVWIREGWVVPVWPLQASLLQLAITCSQKSLSSSTSRKYRTASVETWCHLLALMGLTWIWKDFNQVFRTWTRSVALKTWMAFSTFHSQVWRSFLRVLSVVEACSLHHEEEWWILCVGFHWFSMGCLVGFLDH